MITYAVKVKNGRACLFDVKTGAYHRSVGDKVVSAQITGEFVQVQSENGRVALYTTRNGAYVRSL